MAESDVRDTDWLTAEVSKRINWDTMMTWNMGTFQLDLHHIVLNTVRVLIENGYLGIVETDNEPETSGDVDRDDRSEASLEALEGSSETRSGPVSASGSSSD